MADSKTSAHGRKFYLTDVFGVRRYSGNQLATIIDTDDLAEGEMQDIAWEINFSETTFVKETAQGHAVRIFTPRSEVPFAGHPVLGTAWIIREKILQQPLQTLTLQLPIGAITVSFSETEGLVWMRQPPMTIGEAVSAAQVAATLGLAITDIDYEFATLEVSTGLPHIIVPLKSPDALRRIRIDRAAEARLVERGWAKSILAFAPSDESNEQAFAVRVFAGFYGVDEDAATGSGNGALAAYLLHTDYLHQANLDIIVGQGQEIGRPSTLYLRAQRRGDGIQVDVGGQVIDVAEGVWGRDV